MGHHGSAGSTSDDLLDAVTPEVGIISVGEHNAYGHPSAEAMDRMARRGMTLVSDGPAGDHPGPGPAIEPARRQRRKDHGSEKKAAPPLWSG